MKQGLEKKLMLDLLTHPAEVVYKDDNIAVIIPTGFDSLVFHLSAGNGRNGFVNSLEQCKTLKRMDPPYIVATRNGDRMVVYTGRTGLFGSDLLFRWDYTPLAEARLIKKYPSLIDAFDTIAREICYLPLIKEHTKEVIAAAIKKDPANIRFVKDLTLKDKKYWIRQNPSTFEYLTQSSELANYAMDNTDIGLGMIASANCSASICKKGIRKHPTDLRYVPNHHKTEALMIYAIKQDPRVLSDIKTPTTKMYVEAVRAGKNGWDYVPESLKKKVKKLL